MVAAVLLVVACGPSDKTVETSDAKAVASAENATTVAINTESSMITWIGSKPAGQHNGTIQLTEGQIGLNNNEIVSANFTIDISSLKNIDMAGSKGATDLETHLMSDEFFDEATYPEATFELTGATAYEAENLEADKEEFVTEFTPATLSEVMVENPTHFISGNLTMRGTTKNITFPASVSVTDGVVKAIANFNIDRTEWNLAYGDEASALDKAKDKFVYNTVSIGFVLEAGTKASL